MRRVLVSLLFTATAGAQTLPPSAAAVAQAMGVERALQDLSALTREGQGEDAKAMALRQTITAQVLLASFDADEMLGRIDAEAAHAEDSRYVLVSQQEHRSTELNVATFAISGALSTVGSALQLSSSLNRAGGILNVAAGATAITLSAAQLKVAHGDKRTFRSPYNMLAQVLGAKPNAASQYPPVVTAYLHAPSASDGQLPDEVAPDQSLPSAWYRLHRLQKAGSKGGASLGSVTSDFSEGTRLTADELANREAMLRDLHGAVALLKTELRTILLSMQMTALRPPPMR